MPSNAMHRLDDWRGATLTEMADAERSDHASTCATRVGAADEFERSFRSGGRHGNEESESFEWSTRSTENYCKLLTLTPVSISFQGSRMSPMCRTASWFPVALATLLLCACADPSVRYEKVEAGSASVKSLKADQVVFGLRGTDVTIFSKEADDPACKAKVAPTSEEWGRCLDGVVTLLTPTVSSDRLFLATSNVDTTFQTLHLYSSPLNDQPGNLSEIAFSFSDTKAQAIGSIGAGAVAGSAFGPAGTILGGLLAFAGASFTSNSRYDAYIVAPGAKLPVYPLTGSLCNPDAASGLSLDKMAMQSVVPYVVSLEQAARGKTESCWHTVSLLKRGSPKGGESAWSGWVYQLRLTDLPAGSYDEATAFAAKDEPSRTSADSPRRLENPSGSFPYVPCQEAELRLSWATELAKEEKDRSYRSMRLLVANPAYLRYLAIPKTGTIKLGAVCNASVVPGVFSGSTPQATTDALLKAVADIKAARPKP